MGMIGQQNYCLPGLSLASVVEVPFSYGTMANMPFKKVFADCCKQSFTMFLLKYRLRLTPWTASHLVTFQHGPNKD